MLIEADGRKNAWDAMQSMNLFVARRQTGQLTQNAAGN
jgi:hypothetical protein